MQWAFEVGTPGFTPGTGTGVDSLTTTDTTGGVAGLLPNTSYELYLRDSCTGGIQSPYTGPIVFTTKVYITDHARI
ncbi:MAG: hypothetical protein U5L96_03240 [Owenweeksia sp.]|nr:hypothetical protein [Owenweeksia sp.]